MLVRYNMSSVLKERALARRAETRPRSHTLVHYLGWTKGLGDFEVVSPIAFLIPDTCLHLLGFFVFTTELTGPKISVPFDWVGTNTSTSTSRTVQKFW